MVSKKISNNYVNGYDYVAINGPVFHYVYKIFFQTIKIELALTISVPFACVRHPFSTFEQVGLVFKEHVENSGPSKRTKISKF